MKNLKIQFGKYKGKPFKKIPKDYLAWLLKNDVVYGNFKQAALEAIITPIYTFRIDVSKASKGNGSYFVDAYTRKRAINKIKPNIKKKRKTSIRYKITNLGQLNKYEKIEI